MPVTVVVPKVALVIELGPAGVSVQRPVAPGMMFPSRVTVPEQLVLSVALAVIPLLLMLTSSKVLQVPCVTVHRNVLTPELRLLTPVVFSIVLAMMPVPMVRDHEPVPWLGGTETGSIAARLAVVTHRF